MWQNVNSEDELNLCVCLGEEKGIFRPPWCPIISNPSKPSTVQETQRFLLYVPLNFHTPVNADGSINHFTTYTQVVHTAMPLTCTFHRQGAIKNRTKPGWVTVAHHPGGKGSNTLVLCYCMWRLVCFMTMCVGVCVVWCVCESPHRGCAWMLEACCNIKEKEHTGGQRGVRWGWV